MTTATISPARKFVPASVDPADFAQLEPLYQSLLDRKVSSTAELENWLADLSELTAVADEYGSRRYIDKSCHTDDAQIEARFLSFIENVEARVKPLFFQLQKALIESPHSRPLHTGRMAVVLKKWQADVEIFRAENVPLETEVTRVVNEYDKINGKMMVNFRGGTYTMQQMARFSEDTDRKTRQEAWETATSRRLVNRNEIETIYDKLLGLRQKIAQNAGMPDYRAWTWKALKRFDYTPDDCIRFGDTIAQTCVPIVKRLNQQRAAEMNLASPRPWDLDVDVRGRSPLRPFAQDQTQLLVSKTREIFQKLSPDLAADFDQLSKNGNLDLDSRKGKQPGGYQMSLEESAQPFIFMNAAGLQRDVETLLHEGGHAFHFLSACRSEPRIIFLRGAPMEFCEVASMSMELLGGEHLDVFYNSADAARARRKMIEGIVRFFPWMTTIDQFQHWIYTHPGHSVGQRRDQWLRLMDRYGGGTDYSGYEAVLEAMWQRQGHLFHAPFYYIEYGIAQLGAMQLWLNSRTDTKKAIAEYRSALALGGTRPLPELFSAAGIRFDFSPQTFGPLMRAMEDELARLPS